MEELSILLLNMLIRKRASRPAERFSLPKNNLIIIATITHKQSAIV
jgi:hypothetical protein